MVHMIDALVGEAAPSVTSGILRCPHLRAQERREG